MSYQVLARKWRPRSFKEMAGQGHVLKTLINSLDNDRLHHAYLFTGTRGVGKTSIARILARCLNCEEGVSSEPCGKCSACTEIEEGRFIDLIEVDAASRTKVEDTRELLDNVQYAPTRGRYKVYLIDEVHMLSGHSFNALLKTLEEPPPHVKFLLATTDPQKLPVTVLSRCLQFSLKNLSPEMIMQHLKFILEQEKIEFEEEALWQIGRAAKGSVRDALTLLDQAISFCDGKLTDTEISSFLGTIDQNILTRLVDALIAEDPQLLLELINKASDQTLDFASILEALLSYLHRVAVAQVVPAGLDNSQGDKKQILAHAAAMPAENVQLYYQIALKGREDLMLAVDDRSGLEMTLLRMLAFTPQGVPNKPVATLAKVETEVADSVVEVEKKKPLETIEVKAQAKSDFNHVLTQNTSTSQSDETDMDEQAQTSAAENKNNSPIEPELSLEKLQPEHWITLFYAINLTGITRSIAAHCLLKEVDKHCITLALEASHSKVIDAGHQETIEKALSDYFATTIELRIVEEELVSELETPAAYRLRKQQERQLAAEETFKNDDNVKILMERFEGSILPDSIEPLTPEDY